jgi:phasin family protein
MNTQLSIQEMNKAQEEMMATLISLAETNLAAIESLTALNMGLARDSMAKMGEQAHQSLSIKTPQELVSLHAAMIEPNTEHSVAYARTVYEITKGAAIENHAALRKLVDESMVKSHKMMEDMANNAPYVADVAKAAINQAMHSAKDSYAQMKQVNESALAFAESATEAVVRKTSTRKSK